MDIEKPYTLELSDSAYTYISRSIMPIEIMISLPVPLQQDSRLMVAFFGTTVMPLRDGTNSEVYSPRVYIYVDWKDGKVQEHKLASQIVPIEEDQPVGLLHPPEFAGIMTGELAHKIERAQLGLYRIMDKVCPLYGRESLTQSERDLVILCNHVYHRIVNPDIWNLYEALNPDFFRWMEEHSAIQMECPNCGEKNRSGNKFCTKCGNPLKGESE